jgi:thiaminase
MGFAPQITAILGETIALPMDTSTPRESFEYVGSIFDQVTVCEWSYLSWANVVKDTTVRDDFVTYEWVDLHSGEDFEKLVEYVRNLLDKEGSLFVV